MAACGSGKKDYANKEASVELKKITGRAGSFLDGVTLEFTDGKKMEVGGSGGKAVKGGGPFTFKVGEETRTARIAKVVSIRQKGVKFCGVGVEFHMYGGGRTQVIRIGGSHMKNSDLKGYDIVEFSGYKLNGIGAVAGGIQAVFVDAGGDIVDQKAKRDVKKISGRVGGALDAVTIEFTDGSITSIGGNGGKPVVGGSPFTFKRGDKTEVANLRKVVSLRKNGLPYLGLGVEFHFWGGGRKQVIRVAGGKDNLSGYDAVEYSGHEFKKLRAIKGGVEAVFDDPGYDDDDQKVEQ